MNISHGNEFSCWPQEHRAEGGPDSSLKQNGAQECPRTLCLGFVSQPDHHHAPYHFVAII